MNWYVKAWQDWSDFSSRSMRIEYWMFALVNGVVAGFLGFLEGAAGWWNDHLNMNPKGGRATARGAVASIR